MLVEFSLQLKDLSHSQVNDLSEEEPREQEQTVFYTEVVWMPDICIHVSR